MVSLRIVGLMLMKTKKNSSEIENDMGKKCVDLSNNKSTHNTEIGSSQNENKAQEFTLVKSKVVKEDLNKKICPFKVN